jgi:AraC family ethanolamine operon transcriptional activator
VDRIIFNFFEEYADAIRDVDCRFTLTGREEADWSIRVQAVGRLTLLIGQDGGPCIYEGANREGVFILLLPLDQPERMLSFGQELRDTSLAAFAPGRSSVCVGKMANRWVSVHIPLELLLASSERFVDREIATLVSSGGVLTLDPQRLRALRSLVMRLVGAEDAEALATPAAAGAAEGELLSAIMLTLDTRARALPSHPGRPAVSRQRVLERALGLITTSDGAAVYVEDLSDAAHVSERTLRNVFHESFGIGPIRYLRLCQLHRIRAGLRDADPDRDTITKVATECGVWDLSRLAREYRALFGELPTQTLRTPISYNQVGGCEVGSSALR